MRNVLGIISAGCLAVGFLAGTIDGAQAAPECKPDKLVVKGDALASRTLGAYPSSLFAWRAAAEKKYGSKFQAWRNAADRDVDCKEVTVDGSKRWQCTRTARACTTGAGSTNEEASTKLTCQSAAISSYGKTMKTEDEARNQAHWGWRLDVRKKYGKTFENWELARDRDVDCEKTAKNRVRCVAIGVACKA